MPMQVKPEKGEMESISVCVQDPKKGKARSLTIYGTTVDELYPRIRKFLETLASEPAPATPDDGS